MLAISNPQSQTRRADAATLAAVAIHYMHYNFARIHQSLPVTPTMAANVTNRLWSVEDIGGAGRLRDGAR